VSSTQKFKLGFSITGHLPQVKILF